MLARLHKARVTGTMVQDPVAYQGASDEPHVQHFTHGTLNDIAGPIDDSFNANAASREG